MPPSNAKALRYLICIHKRSIPSLAATENENAWACVVEEPVGQPSAVSSSCEPPGSGPNFVLY
jgi:hypothetical protein